MGKITDMAAASSASDSDVAPIVQSGTNKKITLATLVSFIVASSAMVAAYQAKHANLTSLSALTFSSSNSRLLSVDSSGTALEATDGVKTTTGGLLKIKSFTFATLPSASTAGAGAILYITDSNVITFNATITATGANSCLARSDGTNWKVF